MAKETHKKQTKRKKPVHLRWLFLKPEGDRVVCYVEKNSRATSSAVGTGLEYGSTDARYLQSLIQG